MARLGRLRQHARGSGGEGVTGMTFTLSLAWWHIPALISFLSLAWAFFWPADDSGMFGGITRMFMLVPALAVAMLAWLIGGFFK